MLQGQGSPARQTSKDFELYEDTSPLRERVKSSPTKLSPIKFSPYKFSPMKIDDKENDDPFPWHKTEMGDDPFVRPLPRGPLNKLRRSGQGDTEAESIVGKKTMMEEITTESFAGGNITRETTGVVTEVVSQSRRKSENSFPFWHPFNESLEFDIHQDNPEDLEMADYNKGVENIMFQEEDDKENDEPKRVINKTEIELLRETE